MSAKIARSHQGSGRISFLNREKIEMRNGMSGYRSLPASSKGLRMYFISWACTPSDRASLSAVRKDGGRYWTRTSDPVRVKHVL